MLLNFSLFTNLPFSFKTIIIQNYNSTTSIFWTGIIWVSCIIWELTACPKFYIPFKLRFWVSGAGFNAKPLDFGELLLASITDVSDSVFTFSVFIQNRYIRIYQEIPKYSQGLGFLHEISKPNDPFYPNQWLYYLFCLAIWLFSTRTTATINDKYPVGDICNLHMPKQWLCQFYVNTALFSLKRKFL